MDINDNKQKGFLSHFFIIGGGTLLNMIIGLLTTPIITRIVSPVEYGQLSIFNMYTNIAGMILCLGLDQSLVRFFYRSDENDYKRKLLILCAGIPIIISCIISALFVYMSINNYIDFEFEGVIVILLGINIIFFIINRFAMLVLRITYESKIYSFCNILQKIIYVGIVLLLSMFLEDHYLLILTSATVVAIIIPTIYALKTKKDLWKVNRLNFKEEISVNIRELLVYGLPLVLSMGITTLFQSIDKISLNYYCTYTEVGVYSSAMTLVNIFAIIQTTFNAVWGPMKIEHYEKDAEDKTFFQKGNQIITVIMFFMGIHLILFKDVFAILLGDKYREAAYILPCLMFNPMMLTISETTNCGISFFKKSYMNIIIAVVACLVNILGNMCLVPSYGCQGAAISTGLAYIVFWFLRTIISNKYYYVDYKLKKFSITLVCIVIYALYNTFFSFNIMSVISYILCVSIFFILYRADFKEIICIGKNQLQNLPGFGKYFKRKKK